MLRRDGEILQIRDVRRKSSSLDVSWTPAARMPFSQAMRSCARRLTGCALLERQQRTRSRHRSSRPAPQLWSWRSNPRRSADEGDLVPRSRGYCKNVVADAGVTDSRANGNAVRLAQACACARNPQHQHVVGALTRAAHCLRARPQRNDGGQRKKHAHASCNISATSRPCRPRWAFPQGSVSWWICSSAPSVCILVPGGMDWCSSTCEGMSGVWTLDDTPTSAVMSRTWLRSFYGCIRVDSMQDEGALVTGGADWATSSALVAASRLELEILRVSILPSSPLIMSSALYARHCAQDSNNKVAFTCFQGLLESPPSPFRSNPRPSKGDVFISTRTPVFPQRPENAGLEGCPMYMCISGSTDDGGIRWRRLVDGALELRDSVSFQHPIHRHRNLALRFLPKHVMPLYILKSTWSEQLRRQRQRHLQCKRATWVSDLGVVLCQRAISTPDPEELEVELMITVVHQCTLVA
ncbi:hypothetical protein EXIGLDRAFT_173830 [Exidia glandulosa HHB12029]|uniref:Uncharacterized protein n=1 Tax=Exidia glandulosa HHB12029 TaxID=1314781 RepID=A0A165F7V9_EXIGL|nr:hypothetical protein EXIGLDRAFT_173830 [Exidia glandulosa HHB12029]